MIELEIQGLAESRDGLLIDVSRLILATGFTLRRQRLVQDAHGILLSMVVYGQPRKQRALEKLLDSYERLISFSISPVVNGELKPHFAASLPQSTYRPAALPTPAEVAPPLAATPSVTTTDQRTDQLSDQIVDASVDLATDQATEQRMEQRIEQSIEVTTPAGVNARQGPRAWQADPDFEFIQPIQHAPVDERATPVEATPFVEVELLGPDEAAVDQALRSLEYDYPHLAPKLLALQAEVADGARESSLVLAGQRVGAWVFAREHTLDVGLELLEAVSRIGAPGLRALVEVDQRGTQLRILNSTLCTAGGHSGCSFFLGFLEGLLSPAIAPHTLSIFPVCCRSYGASECVLEISD